MKERLIITLYYTMYVCIHMYYCNYSVDFCVQNTAGKLLHDCMSNK